MNLVTRTIYNSYLQSCLLLGSNFTLAAESTLNEVYGIQSGVSPVRTPKLGYFSIGNGGHAMSSGVNGITITNPIQHSATDANLYHSIPFILRPVGNDIQDRSNYALRRTETHGGNQYIAYYLKRLFAPGTTIVPPTMETISVSGGVTTTGPFVPSSANLNPTPPVIPTGGVGLASGNYVAASAEINISLTANDVSELLNVATIMYGDPAFAIISEIALCSGEDTVPMTVDTGVVMKEAVAVQCLSFINTLFALEFNTSGVGLLLDVGASEPMFTLVSP